MIYAFGDYELDVPRYELRYAGKPVKLEPQVFNVLAYLIQHRDRVVTKEELLGQLWPGRFVSEATLTSRVTAARRAVGDRGREQRLIQTLHGRGYRFIASVEERDTQEGVRRERERREVPAGVRAAEAPPPVLVPAKPLQVVGREAELVRLRQWAQRALRGTRQVVFVAGESGLGKTTLVGAFLQELGGYGPLQVAQGQCIEHYGAGEAYLPVLEALGQLCKAPGGQEIIDLLARRAPTWVVQMPWLVTGAELDTLQRRVVGATQERMLREMAEAVALMATERPLILVLEDLHWSDYATLDLLARLAQLQEPARLLVLGTYRPGDVRQQGHPLRAVVHDLKLHRRGDELPLTSLTEAAVAEYLTARFPGTALPNGLAHLVHRRTEGNPLFMVNVVDAWEAEGWMEEGVARGLRPELDELAQGVPESLRQMLIQQLERLSTEEQRILETASVAGVEFSAAAVAAGLEIDVVEAESRCENLARRLQWLRSIGIDEWPDGTVAGRYSFMHALYHQMAYQQIAAARRAHLHRRIGARLQDAYGPRAYELAAELSVHFERGRDYHRAVQSLQEAAANAIQRYAHRAAITHLTRALELLQTLPDSPERAQQEITLHVTLGPVLIATKGYAAVDVERVYTRARQLCQATGESRQLFPVLVGLRRSHQVRAEYSIAHELGMQLLAMAQRLQDHEWLLEAHFGLGIALFYLGDFRASRDHCEQGLGHYYRQQYPSRALWFGQDPGVACHTYVALALWALGYPEQALRSAREALHLARQLGHPFSLAFALSHAAVLHAALREGQAVQTMAEAALALAQEQGFAFWSAWGRFLRGWAVAVQGDGEAGIGEMRQGLEATRSTGAEVGLSGFLALLAEAYGAASQPEMGREVLAQALAQVDKTGERWWEAELHRLQGALLLRPESGLPASGVCASHEAAEACFRQAISIARHQQAKSWELRAATSLARLWQSQGKRAAAHALLAEIHDWFTEGCQTLYLWEARELLDELT
jgi:DNA-binding winged helix-turn-helix (wHTH) protein/predicted ATPase